jgi:hypothetical protein
MLILKNAYWCCHVNYINMDDRSWMYRRLMDGRLRPEYIIGVRRFINFAFSIDKNIYGGKIRCSCVRCKNQKFL